jgi:2-polyprenyl-6-methoxyphenol hydroxylase-like FAD-dependent oxidoreductase
MRAVVVGAGPAGLASAAALERLGADVVLVDRRRDPTSSGAAIGLWWNGLAAMERLGVAAPLLSGRHVVRQAVYRDDQGRVLAQFAPHEFFPEVATPFVAVRRAELQSLLLGTLQRTVPRFGAGCVWVRQCADHATVGLSDGAELRADLVVGADGMCSFVRQIVLPAARVQTRCTAWTGVARESSPANVPPTFDHVASRRGGAFFAPMHEDEVFWGVITRRPVDVEVDRPLQAAESFLSSWWPRLRRLVHATPDADAVGFQVRELRGLRSCVSGRVAVVGDAAHGMVPHLAQGVSQSVEDAVALADCLAGECEVVAGLRRYNRERAGRGGLVASASRHYARTLAVQDPVLRLAGAGPTGRLARRLVVRAVRHLFGQGPACDPGPGLSGRDRRPPPCPPAGTGRWRD